MIGDIFRYIVGEDELPDEEPAFLPVERPHHAPACTALPPQVVPGGPTCSCLDEVVQPAKRRRPSATAGPGGAQGGRLEALVSDDHAIESISPEAAASRRGSSREVGVHDCVSHLRSTKDKNIGSEMIPKICSSPSLLFSIF